MKRRTKENMLFIFIGILVLAIVISGISGKPKITDYIGGGIIIIGLIMMIISLILTAIRGRREEDKAHKKT